MDKSLMKQLLSFFVFFLLGCVKLSANTANNFEMIATDTSDTVAEYNYSHALLIPQHFIFTSVHTTFESNYRTVYATDNEKVEEEESITTKKATSVATFPKVLYSEQVVALQLTPKKEISSRNYFVYFSSNTIQILFCTFRI
ncbi:hypothetical protein J2X31_002242 [Flavobacterium arsenatis]|uniref:Lipoprotein n=1 Tax=Flavobacterium arsenatis TaxID=1484332 RepID=A0ABU1TQH1_9FLAO|nr:hypothetical protein [Flavobacterium arsenatis]MDR6968225.1 hypothetical protein [Flavobacterium arsenatis]